MCVCANDVRIRQRWRGGVAIDVVEGVAMTRRERVCVRERACARARGCRESGGGEFVAHLPLQVQGLEVGADAPEGLGVDPLPQLGDRLVEVGDARVLRERGGGEGVRPDDVFPPRDLFGEGREDKAERMGERGRGE